MSPQNLGPVGAAGAAPPLNVEVDKAYRELRGSGPLKKSKRILNFITLMRGLLERCSEDSHWFGRMMMLVSDNELVNELVNTLSDRVSALVPLLQRDATSAPMMIAWGQMRRYLGSGLGRDVWQIRDLKHMIMVESYTIEQMIAGTFELRDEMFWSAPKWSDPTRFRHHTREGLAEIGVACSTLKIVHHCVQLMEEGVARANPGAAASNSQVRALSREWLERMSNVQAQIVYTLEGMMREQAHRQLEHAMKQLSDYVPSVFFDAMYPEIADPLDWSRPSDDTDLMQGGMEESRGRAGGVSPWWIGPRSALNLIWLAKQLQHLYEWCAVCLHFREMLSSLRYPLAKVREEPSRLLIDLETRALTLSHALFYKWDNSRWNGAPPGCPLIVLDDAIFADCHITLTPALTTWKGLWLGHGAKLRFTDCTLGFDALIDRPSASFDTLFTAYLNRLADLDQINFEERSSVTIQAELRGETTILADGKLLRKMSSNNVFSFILS
jgi:hypothetical protein